MDGKWNDKWTIIVRKLMKDILISDGKIDNSRAQQKVFTNYKGITSGYDGRTNSVKD